MEQLLRFTWIGQNQNRVSSHRYLKSPQKNTTEAPSSFIYDAFSGKIRLSPENTANKS